MLDIVGTVTDNPELGVVLVVVLRFLVAYQRGLSWTEYRMVHSLKRGLLPTLDKLIPNYPFITTKGYRDDKEFVLTHDDDVRSTFRALVKTSGSPHLINAIKRRETPEGNQLSAAHVVFMHSDGTQTEAYLFPAVDGMGTDVYVHNETSVTRGIKHLTSTKQVDGDPREIVTNALS